MPRRRPEVTPASRIHSAAGRAVGQLFRSARESQRLSQEQLAALTPEQSTAVSRATISDIERGRNLPSLTAMIALSRALHIDPLEVLERVDLAATTPVDLTSLSLDDLKVRAEELFWAADYRAALAVYDAMSDRVALESPVDSAEKRKTQARIEINRAVTFRQRSALRAARAATERAIGLSDGHAELQAEACIVLASLYSHEGNFALSRILAEEGLRLAAGCGSKVLGMAWSQKGAVLYRCGEWEESRRAFLQARKFAIQAGDVHSLVKTEGNIGSCLFRLDDLPGARKRYAKAVDLARKHADPSQEASWLVELGGLALICDDPGDADRFATAALRIARPSDRVLTVFRAEWLRHRIVKHRNPKAPDRHRLAYLRKLYVRVREHETWEEVREFRSAVLDMAGDDDE